MISPKYFLLLYAGLVLGACGGQQDSPVASAPETQPGVIAAPKVASPTPLTELAEKTATRLLKLTANGQLTPLVREAEKTENFQSNFGGQTHSRYWFLLRRVGVDPATKLQSVLAQPHGTKVVGDETWFIWPDFAALDPESIIPERLSFQDRARLLTLIGDDGVESIRQGNPYPGVRLAISDTGRWVYFLLNIDPSEEPE